MITLCQIKSPPSRWKTFVANRVSEIQHLTRGGIWNHVPGTENPADIISRGMTPAQLQYQSLWFHGPCWLKLDKANWPHVEQIREEDLDASLLEERSVAAVLPTIEPSHIFSLNSSLTRLVRGVAYGIRFRHNAKQAHQNSKKLGPITSEEYEDALKRLVRIAQQECFQQEIADLKRGHQVQDNSRIAALNPQLVDGLLCVGGRLQNANVSASRKHPYILDHRHPFTETVIADYHVNLYHAGQQLLLSALRGRFWPTSARNVVRKVIHSCVSCFRARPRVQNQLMADLPPERVNPCFAFQRVGVDYCGPFYLVHGLRRGSPVKCFVAIFVCLVTKAVHLELVANLTTEAFLAALKRFSARRGKPKLIKCDNATNFVGASRELKELHRLFLNQEFQARVVAQTAADRIEFQFIPARTPNFGGLWESAVKSFKTLLKRTVGACKLFYDEMQTILTQIEAILNSRPLTPLSNDPNDFEALTPGHFLIHRPLVAIPEPDLDGIPENRLSAWQAVQHYVQTLWKTWTTQYLSDLHNRTKWTQQKDNIRVGTMVVLMCENIPPLKWPLARVTEVHPGQDGRVRVVTVRTKDGTFKRGVSKICVLPIRDNTVPSSQQGGELASPPPAEAGRPPHSQLIVHAHAPSGPSKPDPAKSRKSSCLVQMRYDRIFDGEPRRSVQSVLEVRAAVVSESDQFARRSQRRTYATEASKSTVYQRSTKKYEFRTTPAVSRASTSEDVRGGHGRWSPQTSSTTSPEAVTRRSTRTPRRAPEEEENNSIESQQQRTRLRSSRSSSMISIAVNSRRRSMYEHEQHTASSSIIQVEVGGRCSSPVKR
ncbi:uncharacterized protein LOC119769525 [Culex quinquefasciatus]|uniref:uncharacterized protein LOC119769525 n=1 Tax=Culex quinquefasciatus TaxID=7176 RepID=UPI0018E3A1D7|nr:uncharacterized protein LOC119769525 [Culex quinquefasciatus]